LLKKLKHATIIAHFSSRSKILSKYNIDCSTCLSRCDGVSKGVYIFQNDVNISEHYEKLIIRKINELGYIVASKCELPGYPDIELTCEGKIIAYIEVKFQQRTFISVQKILPQSDLMPSNTLALNQSDLLRYFEIGDEEQKPIYIVWGLSNRPCITKDKEVKFFYQNIDVLKEIYNKYKGKRRFRRASGKGDVVNGVHKGVVVNWHFSLNEFERFTIKDLIKNLGVKNDKNL
jgi:hypothetical protein